MDAAVYRTPRAPRVGAPRLARAALGLAAPLAAAALAACNIDETVEVQALDQVSPAALNDSTALPTFVAGAQTDFQVAYSGSAIVEGAQVSMSALFTDEMIQTESFPTRYEVDTRNVTRENTTMAPVFLNLHRARASAERASAQFLKFNQPDAGGRLDALNLAGFTYVLFGENYCSGVPVSRLEDDFVTLTFGEAQTREQILQAAVAKFDSVLATTGASATAARLNLARVGRARALLDLGQFAEARTTAAQVPAGFVFTVQHSENTPRQNNGVWSLSTNQGRFGVADSEGGEGLPFVTEADVRVPSRPRATNRGNGFDGGPMREQLKDSTRTTPKTVADGVEAQLIVAEGALRAGDAATFLSTLNGLRSNTAALATRGITAALPALADPGSDAARQDLLFRERAYWLFLTSHRLGDLRRLVRQYGRSAESVYPSGNYSSNGRSGVYGSDLNFPIPIEEGQNPKTPTDPTKSALKGCLDRNA
jgi:hypothetical protein